MSFYFFFLVYEVSIGKVKVKETAKGISFPG